MDLQLGFKLTRPADVFSSANFQLLKDHRGPLFQSRETISMFNLTAHLRGSASFFSNVFCDFL